MLNLLDMLIQIGAHLSHSASTTHHSTPQLDHPSTKDDWERAVERNRRAI